MARFRNSLTGVVVDVDEDTAKRLGAAYEQEDGPKRGAQSKKRSSRTADDD